ncbi:hypothetical protein ELH42_37200 [Rhizobium ruizarguesonis]|jgi:hypothetical protein|uniref:Uncharacterized protein n=1 Tax=Rhizobium ruizarguesonis TaxID=2081791 RepID=A0AB38HT59_9HYPH|nr:hypothetical protein ELI10_36415 [Rhizobium ruizarguesonis]TCA30722.1 hypothetical protein E0H70_14475 [Rhizobium leguminosarum bv. viciae]TAX01920.1 hypothetical protein ELI09_36655 [Rhizobium ruizarguesonis]TAX06448.1 hypothetical protein ELI08_35930 [Rhizobium ruizarguesonis]TAY83378.1 hypothetical protein ELH85_37525 [Rhizobium ruizarguesonis]
MTYVASPSYHREDANRAPNLRQCLETARRQLDENEVREALSAYDRQDVKRPKQEPHVPTMGVVPSSSF